MLSSSPAVPISSFNFADGSRRRLSLVTEHGKELYTAHDGLPSPQHLTPITGQTPAEHTPEEGNTPNESPHGSRQVSRRASTLDQGGVEDGGSLRKVPSRGGLWHDEVSYYPLFLNIYFRRGLFLDCPGWILLLAFMTLSHPTRVSVLHPLCFVVGCDCWRWVGKHGLRSLSTEFDWSELCSGRRWPGKRSLSPFHSLHCIHHSPRLLTSHNFILSHLDLHSSTSPP